MVQQIGVRELNERIKAKHALLLLDVRQPWEHETAALPGSVLIPLDELPSRADEIELPEGATIVAYCHHGVRSLSAAALLERLGFADVVSLRGGIDAWSIHVDPGVPRY
ncbi:Rhodanese-related sulfurtransferase [Minicystis rosea]|nr:Rhodanese-related sulfurtransferase [Minicystis rosea]